MGIPSDARLQPTLPHEKSRSRKMLKTKYLENHEKSIIHLFPRL